MSWRNGLERRSMGPLRRLDALPRPALLLGLAVALLAGLALPGLAGALVLVGIAAFLGWLLLLSWPAVDPVGRLLRLAVIAALVVVAVTRL